MKTIKKISAGRIVLPTKKRVAAYARVSMESDRMAHSLSSQISYYNDLIQNNPEWEFAGVYADRFISGTSMERRTEFKRMLSDCEEGKIDIILTKSISRFARNTIDLLNTVRRLKELGIEVRFEKERIRSLSGDGELMLTLLASFAQEESRSISENVKWATRKRFEQGIPRCHYQTYGYRWDGDTLVPVPEEAAVVKRIFKNFLDGKSRLETEREFASEGITTRDGFSWYDTNIRFVLTNIIYTGNLLLQKNFTVDSFNHKSIKNRGQLPQYYVENNHEAIIDMETFKYVQDEMARRKELGQLANKSLNITCFTGKIKCLICGKSFMRICKRNPAKYVTSYADNIVTWGCKSPGKRHARDIPEGVLKRCCADVLGLKEFDEAIFAEQIEYIAVPSASVLIFHFRNGTEVTREWKSTARKDCWNDEYKALQRKLQKEYMAKGEGRYSPFTTRFKCGVCGRSIIRCSLRKGTYNIWLCRSGCRCRGIHSIREMMLYQTATNILNLPEFDAEVFKSKVDHIILEPDYRLNFFFTDGHNQCVEYYAESYSWTDERRALQSKKIKESWARRKQEEMKNDSN